MKKKPTNSPSTYKQAPNPQAINSLDYDDVPELDDDFFERANLYHGNTLVRVANIPKLSTKQRISIHLDADIIAYFKAQAGGRGY